eukprot:maker-scaffold339_size202159-snap-gene-0.10 protein:Tk01767 transcript:maker-scaffold339_size202159-snap-gene-0.10-mRNA-1 annotation:"hypothetical protein AND_002409"
MNITLEESCVYAQRPEADLSFSQYHSNVAGTVAIGCAILGVIGNLTTLIVFRLNPKLRSIRATPYILSLAVSDLCFSVINLPLTSLRFFFRCWMLGETWCKLFPFLMFSNIITSSLCMMMIALSRWSQMFHPTASLTTHKPWCKTLLVMLTWGAAFGVMALPLLDIWGTMGYSPRTFSCTILPGGQVDEGDPTMFLTGACVLIPGLVAAACYTHMYFGVSRVGQRLRRSISKSGNASAMTVRRESLQREREVARTFLLICIAFFTCFILNGIIVSVDPMPPKKDHPSLHIIGYLVFWSSTFINPIIYFFTSNRGGTA